MSKWKKVRVCTNCRKVYPDSVPEICKECGVRLSTPDNFASMILGKNMITLSENCEFMSGRRKGFKWEVMEIE